MAIGSRGRLDDKGMTSSDVFSPNSAIDAAIKEMLPHFSEVSQRRMKKAIRDAGRAAAKHRDENTDAGARHIFREFIPAYVLNRCGYSLEYNSRVGGKRPDWFDAESGLLVDSYTYERGGLSPYADRVAAAVRDKCRKYHGVVKDLAVKFVVVVYVDFLTYVTLDECYEDRKKFRTAFDDWETLWAVVFFAEDDRPTVKIAGQPYGFLSLTADDTFQQMPYWGLPSVCVRS